jgi:hypothetical protein
VADKFLRVECYAGYKGDERPVRIQLAESLLDVSEVEDRWYSPGATYFRVLMSTGERYVLRRDDAQDHWTLEAFRAGSFTTSGPTRSKATADT